MNFAVDYVDINGNVRWGYLTPESMKLFNEYLKKIKQQEEEGIGNNEILDININQLSKMTIKVYLLDGTIGNPELRHITIIPPFVQHVLKRPEDV